MRQFLNKNGKFLFPVFLILAVTIWFFFGRTSAAKPNSGFFIDEDSGVESIRPLTDIPPLIGAKGNPSVVKIYKYRTPKDGAVHVGYYTKFTPEMKAKLEAAVQHPEQAGEINASLGMLVRSPDSGPSGWVKVTSREGEKIQESIDSSGGAPDTVYP